ncbi:hypothetical protein TOPH_06235 [Tolypocladium ophioglossoides CBS 100239]|uniref:Uncharacterized protein n=1 Tax=Tolypocladium ophioglossoides (strain CBS 100239) TaxID=1163406 RepID=A0A0L0N4M7_TOLOC|nr:hypothetical protein TOPH_06235 [Tolypocladium ophioglossoides CBS 100239]
MRRHRALRRPSSSASSAASTSSWGSHDDDADRARRRPSLRAFDNHNSADHGRQDSATSTSSRSCEGMSADETGEVWKCMLELQRRYGCYNSTRIDLAVNAGEAGLYLMPNPFIIDTLNNSVVDLPDEGWQMLDRCLRSGPTTPAKQKPKRKFWSRH